MSPVHYFSNGSPLTGRSKINILPELQYNLLIDRPNNTAANSGLAMWRVDEYMLNFLFPIRLPSLPAGIPADELRRAIE